MYQFSEFPEDHIVALTIDGHINTQEFEKLKGQLEKSIKNWEEVKLLEVVKSFTGMSPRALFEDVKFGLNHYKDFSKAAVVTDKKWIDLLTKAIAPVAPFPVKVFELSEIDSAKEWLRAS